MASESCECEEGLPEWIMSYADMITILMAFFVVMYSMAGTPDKQKEEAVFQALRHQFGPMVPSWISLGRGNFPHRDGDLPHLRGTGANNIRNRQKGGADQRAPRGDYSRVATLRPGEQSNTGVVVYFAEGSSKLTKKQESELQVAAEELSGKPQKIEIRGHTSRIPLPANAPFRDNWDLAYDRCRQTMDYLETLGIDPQRFRLSVAAENEPAPGGANALERGLNSRVEVFLLSEIVSKRESNAAPAAATPTNDNGVETEPNSASVDPDNQN